MVAQSLRLLRLFCFSCKAKARDFCRYAAAELHQLLLLQSAKRKTQNAKRKAVEEKAGSLSLYQSSDREFNLLSSASHKSEQGKALCCCPSFSCKARKGRSCSSRKARSCSREACNNK